MDVSAPKRELEVIGTGVAGGLADAVSSAWSNLKAGAADLVHHPLSTSGHYLENHWQDAVAGAAIAVVCPRGFAANALVAAWSARGLIERTAEIAQLAARPGADQAVLTREMRSAVGQEGAAFAGALPMTMAGSIFGRAAADAVFGRGLGVGDLAGGRVSAGQVKSNLLAMHDAISPPRVKLVVTDLDGTLWQLYDTLVPAMQENIDRLSAESGLSKLEVAKQIGKVMDERRMHEYPWTLEESALARSFPGTPQEFTDRYSRPYWQTMDEKRLENLQPFPGVVETLQELTRRGVNVAALTDAPMYMALARTTQLGLDGPIQRLYAMDVPEPSPSRVVSPEALDYGRQRVQSFLAQPYRFQSTTLLPREFEKPNPDGLDQILKDYNARPPEVLYIGDSRVKDGGAAGSRSIRYIWARYGSVLTPEQEEMISRTLRPTPLPPPTKAAASAPKAYAPMIAQADSYSELLKHLEPRADYRAVARNVAGALKVPPLLRSAWGYNLIPGGGSPDSGSTGTAGGR